MPLYWLCYRHSNQISVVIEPGASLIHARMRASLVKLDEGEFTEGHELDRKWQVPKPMIGRRLSGYSMGGVGNSVRNRMPWFVQYIVNRIATLQFSKPKAILSSRHTQYQPNGFVGPPFVTKLLALFHRASRSAISLFGIKTL
jgi:hypothetical protein